MAESVGRAVRRAVYGGVLYPAAQLVSGRSFVRVRRRLEEAQWEDAATVREGQWRRLSALLCHAYDTVPYYRKLMEEAGLKPESLAPDDFHLLPVTTRRDLKGGSGVSGVRLDMVSTAVDATRLRPLRTAGTTGTPVVFYRDPALDDWGHATAALFNSWAGIEPGDTRVSFVLHSDFSGFWKDLWRCLNGAGHIEAHAVLARDREAIARQLGRRQPAALMGYPSLLRMVALAIRERTSEGGGRDGGGVGLRGGGAADGRRATAAAGLLRSGGVSASTVIYFSEGMDRDTQDLMRDVFGASVHSRYGAMEFSAMIAQTCPAMVRAGAPADENLHINAECYLVEVADDQGRPVPPGEEGRIIVTDLRNRVMPRIRYDIGDTGSLAPEACPCARGWPLLRTLGGRRSEYLLLPSGRQMPALSLMRKMRVQADLLWEYQFEQTARDRLVVRVVPLSRPGDNPYGEHERARLRAELQAFIGEPLTIEVEVVDIITREPSGKRPILKTLRR